MKPAHQSVSGIEKGIRLPQGKPYVDMRLKLRFFCQLKLKVQPLIYIIQSALEPEP